MAAVRAAGIYWAMALVLGFGLGSVRALALEPRIGATAATLVELPIILLALWIGCGAAIRWARLGAGLGGRAMMGGFWFLGFLATEFALGAALRGWDAGQTLAHFHTPQGAMGLGGFVAAAMFPILRRRS